MAKKILSFATMGRYRLNVMKLVVENLADSGSVYSGLVPSDRSIKTLTPEDLEFVPLKNTFMMKDILFQNIPWFKYIFVEHLLLDLNPRVVHVWPLLVIRKILRKKTTLWGHAWSQSGEGQGKDVIRDLQRRLCSSLLSYTITQAEQLKKVYPNKSIFSAPNALYFQEQMQFNNEGDRKYIIYVSRLVKEKKPELLIESFIKAMSTLPSDIQLIMVGDGPLKATLEQKYSEYDRIKFMGHIDGYENLKKLYDKSIVSVSAGYVGLSITQSFAFGVPMLISKDERHSPEIEAAVIGENSEYFDTDSVEDLSEKIAQFVANKSFWTSQGVLIVNKCKESYTVEKMATGILNSVGIEVKL